MIPAEILLTVIRFSPKLDDGVGKHLSRNLYYLQVIVKLVDVVATRYVRVGVPHCVKLGGAVAL